jgi:hypothetical protein
MQSCTGDAERSPNRSPLVTQHKIGTSYFITANQPHILFCVKELLTLQMDVIALIQLTATVIENCGCVLPDPGKVGVLMNALLDSNYKEWKHTGCSSTTV